jgi:hypothetical protein
VSRIQIRSYLRVGDVFQPVKEAERYDGDCMYVPGAISLAIDGVDVLGIDLWDDVNWLWPFIVQALDDRRRTGSGRRGFPDQPISFMAEAAWAGNTLIRVTDGASINRTAVAPDDRLYETVARAGLEFFAELHRLCPRSDIGREEGEILESWLAEPR